MTPSIGRIVHYTLSKSDAEQIQLRRVGLVGLAPLHGRVVVCQFDIGNEPREGEVFPAIIVRAFGNEPDSYVNLQVFLDGNDVLWATSRKVGNQPGDFAWPVRA